MHSKYKSQWLTDLRSGKYKQVTGVLRSHDNKFCCLGVLIDKDEVWVKWRSQYETQTGENTSLSIEYLNRYGLTINEMDKLITLNDVSRYTFEEIADWIELNIPTEVVHEDL